MKITDSSAQPAPVVQPPAAKVRPKDSDGDNDGDEGLVIEAGYLFAAGATSQSTNGQFRLNLELEM